MPHDIRPELRGPIHVLWRLRPGLPDLRTPSSQNRLERAFTQAGERNGFALLGYSIRRDHLHLKVEVQNRHRLAKGLQALGIRLSKSLNSVWRRRKGGVFAERYAASSARGRKPRAAAPACGCAALR